MATTPYRLKKFKKMGYQAFRAKDVNKDGYTLACKIFPDVYVTNHPLNDGLPENEKVQVFDHSLQTVDLYEKLKWAKGWEQARNEYIAKRNGTPEQVAARIKFFFNTIGVEIDRKFTNDLYMRFTTGSKAKFNVDLR